MYGNAKYYFRKERVFTQVSVQTRMPSNVVWTIADKQFSFIISLSLM